MQYNVAVPPSGQLSVDLNTGDVICPGVNTSLVATAYNLRLLLAGLRAQGWYSGTERPDSRNILDHPVKMTAEKKRTLKEELSPEHFERLRGIAVKELLHTWHLHGSYLGESEERRLLHSMYPNTSYDTAP